jgi:hypothetical protein
MFLNTISLFFLIVSNLFFKYQEKYTDDDSDDSQKLKHEISQKNNKINELESQIKEILKQLDNSKEEVFKNLIFKSFSFNF